MSDPFATPRQSRDEQPRRNLSLAIRANQMESRNASIVEDVVIPPRLLQAAGKSHHSWQPAINAKNIFDPASISLAIDHASLIQPVEYYQPRETDVPKGPLSSQLHRSTSVAVAGVYRSRITGFDTHANRFAIAAQDSDLRAPLYRKTSLPVAGEGLPSKNIFAEPNLPKSPKLARPKLARPALPRSTMQQSLDNFTFTLGGASAVSRKSLEGTTDPLTAAPIFMDEEGTDEVIPTQYTTEKSGRKTLDISPRNTAEIPRRSTAIEVLNTSIQDVIHNVTDAVRRSSVLDMYEGAKTRGHYLQRQRWVQLLFEYGFYAFLIAFIYFILIGVPLWRGAVWWLWWIVDHKFVISGGFSITVGLATLYAFTPLLLFFEPDPPMPQDRSSDDLEKQYGLAHDTALLIPCHKSASLISNTLAAALKIFPPSHIFVLANGNSPTPLDNTEEICASYGVNHVWSAIGSKIVAQFVGCYAAKAFSNVLLIDDDCALPPNFPIVSDRMKGKVKCIGYTIKSVGPNSSKGTLCQQAQDLEYKVSGLQRALAGKIGSATFPHGAIALWEREFLLKTFHEHPGFSVSEDWFFGHVARKLGSRIQMCTSTFTETETPADVFFARGASRGGFGEMTVFKQRFYRWNFFFVNGLWYNMAYILGSWKLGWWEICAKLFVFQEVYETLLYLFTPFVLPISLIVRPAFCGYLLLGTLVLYYTNTIIFNELHLRRKNERVGSVAVYLYYLPYKVALTAVNVSSCYWSMWKYAQYFAQRHPKVTEDEKAVEVVLRLEEQASMKDEESRRRMTVTTVATRYSSEAQGADRMSFQITTRTSEQGERRLTVTAVPIARVASSLASRVASVAANTTPDEKTSGHGATEADVAEIDFANAPATHHKLALDNLTGKD